MYSASLTRLLGRVEGLEPLDMHLCVAPRYPPLIKGDSVSIPLQDSIKDMCLSPGRILPHVLHLPIV